MTTALQRLIDRGLAGTPTAADREPVCSCGCAEPHVIMSRTTYDGAKLSIWSDGTITHGRSGAYLRGLGEGRSNYARRTRARAVRLVADDIALFTAEEIPTVVKVAEKTFAHTYRSEDDRRLHALSLARRALERIQK